MLTEGLSLNASKTRTYTSDVAAQNIDNKLADVFDDDEIVRLNRYIRQVYDDEDVSIEDIEDVDATELAGKLVELLQRDIVDYASVKVVLKALRAVHHPDPASLVRESASLLYYAPRDFCIMVGALAQRAPEAAEQLGEQLIGFLAEPPYSEMTLSKIWVAHLFVTQALPINHGLLERLNLGNSVIERRQLLLLKGLLRDRAFYREQKTRFDQASDWEKPALLYGAGCLARGEYKAWLDTVRDHYPDPLARPYCKWLLDNQEQLSDLLRHEYKVKSKEEAATEIFVDLGGMPAF